MARKERVAQALKEEIGNIIHDELKDPRLGFVTVTRAEVTADLRQVTVFFSVLGKEEDYNKTKIALDSGIGFIRRLIARRIRLRFTPEIIFREDRSSEYSVRIEEVINEIHQMGRRSHKDELRPSPMGNAGEKPRKEGRGEPKKSRRKPKKQ